MKKKEAKSYCQPEAWVMAILTAEVIATSWEDPNGVFSDDFDEVLI